MAEDSDDEEAAVRPLLVLVVLVVVVEMDWIDPYPRSEYEWAMGIIVNDAGSIDFIAWEFPGLRQSWMLADHRRSSKRWLGRLVLFVSSHSSRIQVARAFRGA